MRVTNYQFHKTEFGDWVQDHCVTREIEGSDDLTGISPTARAFIDAHKNTLQIDGENIDKLQSSLTEEISTLTKSGTKTVIRSRWEIAAEA